MSESCNQFPMRIEMQEMFGLMRPVLCAVFEGRERRFWLEEIDENGVTVPLQPAPLTEDDVA